MRNNSQTQFLTLAAFALLTAGLLSLPACGSKSPSNPSPKHTKTPTVTQTQTDTTTPTSSTTPTASLTPTVTLTTTPTSTETLSATPTQTPTLTVTLTATSTPTSTNTFQPTPSLIRSWSITQPFGLAVVGSSLYVATQGSTSYLNKFTLTGTPEPSWTPVALVSPYSVAVDSSGNVYVGSAGGFIYVLDSTGAPVTGLTPLNAVAGMTFGPTGDLYASTTGGMNVYDSSFAPVTQWSAGPSPYGVCRVGTTLFVCQIGDQEVRTFDLSGNPLSLVLPLPGQYVQAIAADSQGRVYVATDAFIRRYDSSGNLQTEFGNYWGYGIAIDGSDNIYVSDYFNSAIRVYAP